MKDRRIPLMAWLLVAFGVALLVNDVADYRSHSTAHAATQDLRGISREIGIGGQVITNPTTATFLTVPAGAEHAEIIVKGNPACWGADPAPPTANSGGEWPVGMWRKIDNDRLYLQSIRVINCAEGATTVKVYYSRSRRATD